MADTKKYIHFTAYNKYSRHLEIGAFLIGKKKARLSISSKCNIEEITFPKNSGW